MSATSELSRSQNSLLKIRSSVLMISLIFSPLSALIAMNGDFPQPVAAVFFGREDDGLVHALGGDGGGDVGIQEAFVLQVVQQPGPALRLGPFFKNLPLPDAGDQRHLAGMPWKTKMIFVAAGDGDRDVQQRMLRDRGNSSWIFISGK